jgi:cytochrome c oxidase subunit 2
VTRRLVAVLGLAVTGSACRSDAAVLQPMGDAAHRAQGAWLTVAIASVVVFVLVAAGVLIAFVVRRGTIEDETRRRRTGERAVLAGGFVLSAAIAIAATVVGAATTTANVSPDAATVLVRVEAHRWWWQVDYLDTGISSANEIVMPTGVPVDIQITSDNVVHSMWFPQLAGRADVIPGRVTNLTLIADQPGVYEGRCAEFCGLQHAHMGIEAIAMSPSAYDTWVAQERSAVEENGQGVVPAGLGVFLASGCDRCHTISGTVADGVIGPDLTHVGSRRTIGAGSLPNTDADMARWIADPWSVKPGAEMPGFAEQLTPYQLGALVDYLEGLR